MVEADDHLVGLLHRVAVGRLVHGVVRRVQEEADAVVARVKVVPARADRTEQVDLAAVAERGAAFTKPTGVDRQ